MTKIESVEFVRLDPTSFKESWGKDSITGGVRFSNGAAQLPDAPGIGVDVDWKRLKAMSAPGEST